MSSSPRLILTREQFLHGESSKELARRAKAGSLFRIRQGVYVNGAEWAALKPWEQYRLRVSAAAETFESRTVFAWHSSASVWGISTIGLKHPVHALTFRNSGGRSRAGVVRHYTNPAGVQVCRSHRPAGSCPEAGPEARAASRNQR